LSYSPVFKSQMLDAEPSLLGNGATTFTKDVPVEPELGIEAKRPCHPYHEIRRGHANIRFTRPRYFRSYETCK
jgi:hypothetical protein